MAKVSWMWGGKRHYGTLIRETKTHKLLEQMAQLKKIKNNGKIKQETNIL